MDKSLKSLFVVCAILLLAAVVSGCSKQQNSDAYRRVHCENNMSGYTVYVGSDKFTDCSKPSPCMSSGCTFECGDAILHSNQYYKVCP